MQIYLHFTIGRKVVKSNNVASSIFFHSFLMVVTVPSAANCPHAAIASHFFAYDGGHFSDFSLLTMEIHYH